MSLEAIARAIRNRCCNRRADSRSEDNDVIASSSPVRGHYDILDFVRSYQQERAQSQQQL